ncbi:MAG: hypothetical protein PHH54_02650 [Candidatus Nanoarchaeia archaeon]|nr:hypothetical protein [Candidatus Nanoarchaeia archaeon]MDD5740860.1 hypothetical protein [Candidatus Nanoarchaeia archaeon]
MDNVFPWIYFPPIYDSVFNLKKIIPSRIKSPKAEYFTLEGINRELTPLRFGDKKQIELLKVLDVIGEAMEEDFAFEVRFYVN